MIRKTLCMVTMLLVMSITTAYAVPPENPHIESGSAADGGNYFEFDASYLGESGWRDLKTPPHWVVETGEVAYCLDHMSESPHGESYGKFDPAAIYSERTYLGLLAIIEHSFPYRNAGLTDSQIRYATANAIRAWLRESAGIGYDFMLPSNNAVRPKGASGQGPYNFYIQLLEKARNGSVVNHVLTTNPSSIELQVEGDKLVGQTTIEYSALNGKYQINLDKFTTGTEIFGYTGNSGDVLKFEFPLSMIGETLNITNAFTGYDNRSPVNVFWLDGSSGFQAVVVPIVDQMNPVTTANITISSAPATLTIIKHGETDDILLQGAEFELYKADDTFVEQLATDMNGRAITSNLSFGDYYIKEITAPVGYVKDDTKHYFIITPDNRQIEIELYNTLIRGNVSIYKTDETGNPLHGVVFGLYNSYNNLIEELITDIDGKATSAKYMYGEYYLKEISTLEGYNLNETPISFQIIQNNVTVELTATNKRIRGRVQIIKYGETNNTLQGAAYGIYDSDDLLIEEITTNDTGIAVSGQLLYGDYYLKEITPPVGYLLSTASIPFQIRNQDEVIELVAENMQIRGKVQIFKTDERDNPLQGVEFNIYTSNDLFMEKLFTDINGIAISNDLPYGEYYLKEINPPIGYVLDNTKHNFSITVDNMIVELDLINHPITGQVGVVKGCGWKPLKDAVIGVYSEDRTLIEELITDAQGCATSVPLEYGGYYIKEITAPPGYVKSDEEFPFTIEINDRTIWLPLENELITGRAQINKVGENNEPLQGAVFRIYDNYANVIDEIISDENGIAVSKTLDYGEYEIVEIKAPVGYNPNPFAVIVNIQNQNEIVEITIRNNPIKGKVKILKTNEDDIPLQGAIFGVYTTDCSLVCELTTDENGEALSPFLVYGSYYLKEITPPIGYNLNEDIIPFSIIRQGQIVSLEVSNTMIQGRVQIKKASALDGELLKGTVFGIFISDDTLIEELVTNESGIALSSELNYGEYYLKELQTTDGYLLDIINHAFSISEDGKIVEMNIRNTPVIGSVEIYFKHIKHCNEIADAYYYTDWVGNEYITWLNDNGLGNKQIDGYSFIKGDYPSEKELIDSKLKITYWYDDPVEGSWNDVVAIPKTGQTLPWWNYTIAGGCFMLAGIFIRLITRKHRNI